MRVDATRVGDDLDAAAHRFRQHRLHRHVDEVGRVAEFRLLESRGGQDRHRGLGEEVEHEVVDLARLHQLRRADHAVAPEARGTADANDLALGCH